MKKFDGLAYKSYKVHITKEFSMKKSLMYAILIATAICFTSTGCSTVKKYSGNISAGDIADLIDLGFGDGPNGPFQVTKSTSKNPVLIIQNDTDRTITVKAEGPVKKTFTLLTKKSAQATVNAGAYHFTATAKGTNGCQGDVTLESFNEYKWVFVIQ